MLGLSHYCMVIWCLTSLEASGFSPEIASLLWSDLNWELPGYYSGLMSMVCIRRIRRLSQVRLLSRRSLPRTYDQCWTRREALPVMLLAVCRRRLDRLFSLPGTVASVTFST